MKAKIQLYKNDGKTDNQYPVKLVLSSERKTRRRTISYASEKNWDVLKNEPKIIHPDYETIFSLIIRCRLLNVKSKFMSLTDFNEAFEIILEEKTNTSMSVSDYFDIEEKRLKAENRFGTANAYKTVKNRFNIFAPNLMLSEVNEELVKNFVFLFSNRKDAYILFHISILRALYNKALRDPNIKLVDKEPFKNATFGLRVKKKRAKNRYLDDNEMRKLINLEKSGKLYKGELRTVRLSLLQYYFCGLNLVDLFFLKKSNFYKDRVLISRTKLGKYREEFDLRVFPVAREILNKMESDDPVYFFQSEKTYDQYITFYKSHYITMRRFQEKYDIKLMPKNTYLNTNAFRHTFATRAKFLRVDVDIIRELMGHERNDIDVAYKDVYPEEIRDAEHLRIISF